MISKKTLLAAAALAAFAGISTAAVASTTVTGTFKVSLQVNATCAVNSAAGNTITLTPVNAGATTSVQSTTFSVNCSNNTPYTLGLAPSNANASGAGVLSGTGTNSGTTIAYQLYSNAAGTTAWGNTAGTNTKAGTGAGMAAGKATTYTAYANATGSTDVQPDTYSDTVNINVSF